MNNFLTWLAFLSARPDITVTPAANRERMIKTLLGRHVLNRPSSQKPFRQSPFGRPAEMLLDANMRCDRRLIRRFDNGDTCRAQMLSTGDVHLVQD
jgi:hypothetical protein